MNSMLVSSTFFGVFISLLTYQAGLWLKKKTGLAIMNPLLVSVVLTILILLCFKVDYSTYQAGAKYLSYLLTPSTICLAIPLYQQVELLKKNLKAILLGITSGVLTSLISILAFSILFGFTHEEYVTFMPKSITTAIGMALSEQMGGYVSITVAIIVITGVFGNIIAETVCKVFKIQSPIARGIGIGSASHAIGTSKAMEMGEIEGAMSGLSIAVCGLLTVIFAIAFSLFY